MYKFVKIYMKVGNWRSGALYMLTAFQQITNDSDIPLDLHRDKQASHAPLKQLAYPLQQRSNKISKSSVIYILYEGDIITNPSYINYGSYHPWLRLVLLKESPSLSQLCDHLVIPALTKNEYSIMAVLVVLDKNNCYIAYLTYLYRSYKLYSIFIL